ncbi:MAG: hypothetical protein Q4E65_03285 [Clostridia bacterium]|nr:hypothetical protein [Clostridia bacterium]
MIDEKQVIEILTAIRNEMATKDDIAGVKDDIAKINVCIENEIMPKINALYKGQAAIKDMLTPRSKVEELEDEIKFLKSFVYQMREELQQLKKAQ